MVVGAIFAGFLIVYFHDNYLTKWRDKLAEAFDQRRLKQAVRSLSVEEQVKKPAPKGLEEISVSYQDNKLGYTTLILKKKNFPILFNTLDLDKDGKLTEKEYLKSKDSVEDYLTKWNDDGLVYFIKDSRR